MKRVYAVSLVLVVLALGAVFHPEGVPLLSEGVPLLLAEPGKAPDVPVKGMVTMLDLGAKSCIPCKMMAPIMEKLEKDYKGKAAIIFIDVWKEPDQAKRFGIRAIPTQVFYDKEGKEVYRHEGFMSENAIVTQLKDMGVQ
jgi:thioredoxin 1